jgi:recombination protein RecT
VTKALAKQKIDKLKTVLSHPDVQLQFKNAMGKHADSFTASLIDVYGGDNYLQKCDPTAVIQEALKAAVLKLPVSKGLGFAYIVPYGNSPQFQIGYKGMIQLAMRSGQMKILNADAVYEGELGATNRLTGMFELTGQKKSNLIIGYFVYMELINGFQKAEYWTKDAVTEHAKKFSKSFNSPNSAWKSDFDSMAKKTVLRSVLGKYAPMSVEFMTAMTYDNEELEKPEAKDITDEAHETKSPSTPPPAQSDKSAASPQTTSPKLTSSKTELVQVEVPKLHPDVQHLKELWKNKVYKATFAELMKEDKIEDAQELEYIIKNNQATAAAKIVAAIEEKM